jgi:hypothetical protein
VSAPLDLDALDAAARYVAEGVATSWVGEQDDLGRFRREWTPEVALALIDRVRAAERERDEADRALDENILDLGRSGQRADEARELAESAMSAGLDECTRLRAQLTWARDYLRGNLDNDAAMAIDAALNGGHDAR